MVLSPIHPNATERIIDHYLHAIIQHGQLEVRYPSGRTHTYGNGTDVPVRVSISALPLSKLLNPALYFGEAYMDGSLEIAEDQLDDLFRLMSQNESDNALGKLIEKLPRHHKNKKSVQQEYISQHYDKGNAYYKLWLDASMTYSCAYFVHPDDSLEQAQEQKIEHLLRKLQLRPGQKLLDIGCGWGYLAVAAAKQYGVTVLGITLSHEQLAGARQLAKQQGVEKQVKFKLANYMDLPYQRHFDRVISVGMYEHVGKGNHASYFAAIDQLLKDDGVSVLHTITARNDRPTSPWIDKYIFPGGYLPPVSSIEKLMEDFKFCCIDRENLWQHYALTLHHWRSRHQEHKEEVISMFDERFYRMQDFWLAGSEAAFLYTGTCINQFIFTKKKPMLLDWPLTRQFILP
jgi:cyclopropane-fatty-acyl-phospholipid synthase